jgi:hypothetical protein
VKKEDFVLDSEYLVTLVVVVNKLVHSYCLYGATYACVTLTSDPCVLYCVGPTTRTGRHWQLLVYVIYCHV